MMSYDADILNSLIPITQFNRGQASRIFDRLHSEKKLIVLKNNQPAAVILSPDEYRKISEMEEDYVLLLEAVKRMEDNKGQISSMEEVMKDLGITEDELNKAEDPALE